MCIRDSAEAIVISLRSACVWPGHIFTAGASPRSLPRKLAMSPSSTAIHGDDRDTIYGAFEQVLQTAFFRDKERFGRSA